MKPLRLLILGGTTEASRLASALVDDPVIDALLSLAGRTQAPAASPIPYRIGGFGGALGLAEYLRIERIDAVVDATHPFAARISANAVTACAEASVPLLASTRPPWSPEAGDRWISVSDLAAAATALGPQPRRVLLTNGRQGVGAFRASPQHRFVIRTIDPPDAADLPPRAEVIQDRGPFTIESERALMLRFGIECLVTKNSGGVASAAKLAAARDLGLPVVMVERPAIPARAETDDLDAVLRWIADQRP